MANISGPGVAAMSDYRAYRIGEDGHVASFRAFVCDSDTDAAVWAKQLFDGYDIELWSGDRLVARLKSKAKSGAISHEVMNGPMVARRNKFQVRKNAHQTPPRIKTASIVLTVKINSIDGPGSA